MQCSPSAQPASLTLSARPLGIDDRGAVTEITLKALDRFGQPGRGAVKVTSTAGSLRDGETVTLGADGTASVGFSCVKATDGLCQERVRVVGEWVVAGERVGGELRVPVGPEYSTGPRVSVEWDDAGVPGPCLMVDAGTRACLADGGCQRGFQCVFDTAGSKQCVLRGGTGDVQVTLRFAHPVDLDLHVFEPLPDAGACRIYYADEGPTNSCGSRGALDLDSNAGCRIDNVDVENVIYPTNRIAPKGAYGVAVDYFDDCNIGIEVPWQIEVRAGGELRYWCGSYPVGSSSSFRDVTTFVVK